MSSELDKLWKIFDEATEGPWQAGRKDMLSYDGDTGLPFKNGYTPIDEDEIKCTTDKPFGDSEFIAWCGTNRKLIRDLIEAAEECAGSFVVTERLEDALNALKQALGEK